MEYSKLMILLQTTGNYELELTVNYTVYANDTSFLRQRRMEW